MPRFCASCGTQMDDSVTFCANCGTAVGQSSGAAAAAPAPAAAPAQAAAGGMEDNVAGMIAYITIIPAIIFLVMEPYNKRQFVRFHCFQNIFFSIAMIALSIVLMIVSAVLAVIPIIGWIISLLLWLVLGVGGTVLWVVLLVKAYQNQKFKLPFIGDLAEKQANG